MLYHGFVGIAMAEARGAPARGVARRSGGCSANVRGIGVSLVRRERAAALQFAENDCKAVLVPRVMVQLHSAFSY